MQIHLVLVSCPNQNQYEGRPEKTSPNFGVKIIKLMAEKLEAER